MNYEEFNHFTGGLESCVKIGAILIGGFWAYGRFVRQRERHPLIEFTVDFAFIGKHQGQWLIELVAYIENKGKVQHKISEFEFDMSALFQNDTLEDNQEYGGQVFFSHAVRRGSWLPARYKCFFVDPGTKAKYSYVTRVPDQARFLILHSWFCYADGKSSHTAERTVLIPQQQLT